MSAQPASRREAAPYPLIAVAGAPFERGRQFGRACGDLIVRYPDILRRVMHREARLRDPAAAPRPIDDDELLRRALRFVPAMERFSPDYVAEMRGVAAGAEVPFAVVVLANVRAEIGLFDRRQPGEGCTSFAVAGSATAAGGALVGQNQDQSAPNAEMIVILRVEPDRGPRLLMATFAGLLGYGGINSAGVGMMQNALANSTWRFAMPHYPLKRVLLEQADIAGCIAATARAQLCSSQNYALVDAERAVCLETTPDGYRVLPARDGRIAHANNFLDPELARDEKLLAALPDSAARARRMGELAAGDGKPVTVADAQAWLRDHDGHPTGICRHQPAAQPEAIQSLYGVVGEPAKGLLHITRGNPCENAFATYALD